MTHKLQIYYHAAALVKPETDGPMLLTAMTLTEMCGTGLVWAFESSSTLNMYKSKQEQSVECLPSQPLKTPG